MTTEQPGVLRYGVIGDSYSNGEGVGMEYAWPTQLALRLTGAGQTTSVVVNDSVTGWTSAQAIESEVPAFERAKPQVATLQIGVNDWVQGVPADTFRANFRRLLTAMLAVVGKPEHLICVTIPDFSVTPDGKNYAHGRDVTAGIAGFNRIIAAECAERSVTVVDVFDLSRHMDDPELTADDGLHPSAQELALWTDRIEPVAQRQWANVTGD